MQIEELHKLTMACPENHYLRLALTTGSSYWEGFIRTIVVLMNQLENKKFDDLVKNKLQLCQPKFDEKQFVQIACESSVNAYFASSFPNTFNYEVVTKPTTNKDVDCSYSDSNFKYFIEVKCSDFKEKEKISAQDGFKFSTFGRLPNYSESFADLSKMLDEGQINQGVEPKPVLKQKNMDNTLKDFLTSAHSKFNDNIDENEVNILVVCCGDPSDMQCWYSYMYAYEGLFTNESFYDATLFNNVDMVVLTNLYHRHSKFYEKNHLNEVWSLGKACNFIFSNQFRKSQKQAAMMHFINTFPHYTYDLFRYEVPGSAEQYVKDVLRISYFVKEMLTDKGTVLF